VSRPRVPGWHYLDSTAIGALLKWLDVEGELTTRQVIEWARKQHGVSLTREGVKALLWNISATPLGEKLKGIDIRYVPQGDSWVWREVTPKGRIQHRSLAYLTRLAALNLRNCGPHVCLTCQHYSRDKSICRRHNQKRVWLLACDRYEGAKG